MANVLPCTPEARLWKRVTSDTTYFCVAQPDNAPMTITAAKRRFNILILLRAGPRAARKNSITSQYVSPNCGRPVAQKPGINGISYCNEGLNGPPGFERRGDGAVVEIIQLAADGHPVGKARHRHIRAVKLLGDVMRGGLA